MLKIMHEFRSSLKDTVVEEVVDLTLFRPISFLIVKLIYPLPITPNHLSILSILIGVSAGFVYALGDRRSWIFAGILYAFSHILDCCDGMVARLKKNGTPIGRIIDGWADYITTTAVYIGLLVALQSEHFDLGLRSWFYMVAAAVSLFVHSSFVDYYRQEFLAHALKKNRSIQNDLDTFSRELNRLRQKRGHWIIKLMLVIYLWYTRFQLKTGETRIRYDADLYERSNKTLIHLWNWIGPSTHIAVLLMATFLYSPPIYFVYTIGLANLWLLGLLLFQVRTNRRIALSD